MPELWFLSRLKMSNFKRKKCSEKNPVKKRAQANQNGVKKEKGKMASKKKRSRSRLIGRVGRTRGSGHFLVGWGVGGC